MIRISHWTNVVLISVLAQVLTEGPDGRSRRSKRSQRGFEHVIEATHHDGAVRTSGVKPHTDATHVAVRSSVKGATAQTRNECPLLTDFLERRTRS